MSNLEILYDFLTYSGSPKALTSVENNSVTSITVAVLSLEKAFIGNVKRTGSKLELTTASYTGNSSSAPTLWETTLSKICFPFFLPS